VFKYPLALVVVLIVGLNTYAQDLEGVNVVHLLGVAQRLTFEGKLAEANNIFETILRREPEYHEARIFYARSLAWEKHYDDARKEIRTVLQYDPWSLDALELSIDIETWSNNPWKAAELAYEALLIYPNNEAIIFKKAYALHLLEQDELAMEELHNLFLINPAHTEGKQLLTSLTSSRRRNIAALNFELYGINNWRGEATNWSVQLGRVTKHGPAIVKLNRASRLDMKGWQVELETSPRLDPRTFLHLHYAWSPSTLFASHRASSEVYFRIPPHFEASGGLRLLTFIDDPTTFIVTGSGKWYKGNFSFQYRPYFIMSTSGTRFSSSITTRKHFNDSENFLALDLIFGYSPDERNLETTRGLFAQPIYNVASRHGALTWQKTLRSNTTITLNVFITRLGQPNEVGQYIRARGGMIGLRKRF
jgi:YaiO family outer membrane protein